MYVDQGFTDPDNSRDFPFLKVAKGKNNFSCAVKDDLIEMVLTDADCVFQTTERNATIQ